MRMQIMVIPKNRLLEPRMVECHSRDAAEVLPLVTLLVEASEESVERLLMVAESEGTGHPLPLYVMLYGQAELLFRFDERDDEPWSVEVRETDEVYRIDPITAYLPAVV